MKGHEQTYPQLGVDEMRAAFEEAHKRGKKTAAHVIGTTAIASVLDAGVDMLQHGIYLDKPLAERMVKLGTYYCPTLSGYGRQTMNPKYQRGEAWAKAHSVLVKPHEESIAAAVQAGVKIVTGTDTTGVYTEEVELMREAGLSAMDSIRACTLTAAEALGLEDEIGSIEVGKSADVVLLDGDPLSDAQSLGRVHVVMKGGVLYDPREISL
jgi:imidazolonepropionase-like amidohydrolase